MEENNSCVGCKFLYSAGVGYSNYTWLENDVCCARGMNKNLPETEPSDWSQDPDNWPSTNNSRCDFYSPGCYITLDIDGDDSPGDYSEDMDQINAISCSSGRMPYSDE